MRGNITQRGEKSWRIKYEIGRDPVTGRRRSNFETVQGNKKDAQTKLSQRLTEVAQNKFVEPSKKTVGEFVGGRIDQWEASGKISVVTAARYRELLTNQIAPHIGTKIIQKLRPLDIEDWHTTLRTSGHAKGKGGVGPRTIGHAHRVLSKALGDAVKNELTDKNVAKAHSAPKAPDEDMVIVQDVPAFISRLKTSRWYVPAMVALFTGMRRSEVLALR